MDDTTLYVRIRGRVQGPFELEKLRALVRRGQLGRMHEVSPDNVVWQRAGDYPDLFSSVETKEVAQEPSGSGTADPSQSAEGMPVIDVNAPPHTKSKWYYAHNDVETGPVDFATLQSRIATGEVFPDDQVWAEGMHGWAAAESVAGLVPAHIRAGKQVEQAAKAVEQAVSASTSQDSKTLGRDVARSLGDSRPWIMFLVVWLFSWGAVLLILGAFATIHGARERENALLGGGLMMFLYSGVAIAGALYLLAYHGRLGRFLHNRTEVRLDVAFRALKSFWVFVSLIALIILVNSVIAAIWVFSAEITLGSSTW